MALADSLGRYRTLVGETVQKLNESRAMVDNLNELLAEKEELLREKKELIAKRDTELAQAKQDFSNLQAEHNAALGTLSMVNQSMAISNHAMAMLKDVFEGIRKFCDHCISATRLTAFSIRPVLHQEQ